jgi:hypothetical protein
MTGEPRRADTELHDEPQAARTAAPPREPEEHVALFADDETRGFRARWEAIQTGFVDEPRAAVEQADALVDEMMKRLTEVFTTERTTLEHQWGRGDNVSTEDLRVALKRYRSFFERLLSV